MPTRAGFDPYLVKLGRRIRELRKAKGWTQEELEQRTQLTAAYISRVETGQQNPSILTLRAVAKAFGVTTTELLHD